MAETVALRTGGDEEIAAARAALRVVVADLRYIRERLVQLHASIPPSPEEIADVEMPDVLDVLTEIRVMTAIVLEDRIDPLIETLNAAAEYQQPART